VRQTLNCLAGTPTNIGAGISIPEPAALKYPLYERAHPLLLFTQRAQMAGHMGNAGSWWLDTLGRWGARLDIASHNPALDRETGLHCGCTRRMWHSPIRRLSSSRFKWLQLSTLCAAIFTAVLPQTALAAIIYRTGFETPTFTANQSVAGQDGWTSRFGSPAGIVSTNNPASGQQALEFGASQLPLFGFGFNLETVRKFLDFDVAAAGARGISVAFDVRLNGPRLQDDLVEAIFSAIDPNFLDYGQMQISADGHLYIYGSQFADFLIGNISLDEYHRLAMRIDFFARETTFEVDGTDIVTFAFDPALQSTIFRAGSLHMAAPTDPLLADPQLYAAYFDNFQVNVIPEPSTLFLLIGFVLIWQVFSGKRNTRVNGSTICLAGVDRGHIVGVPVTGYRLLRTL
jgi:hypothetical protein